MGSRYRAVEGRKNMKMRSEFCEESIGPETWITCSAIQKPVKRSEKKDAFLNH